MTLLVAGLTAMVVYLSMPLIDPPNKPHSPIPATATAPLTECERIEKRATERGYYEVTSDEAERCGIK